MWVNVMLSSCHGNLLMLSCDLQLRHLVYLEEKKRKENAKLDHNISLMCRHLV
jgi:hypothetical protein